MNGTHETHCPGCGLVRPEQDATPPDRYNASGECWQLYGELTAETISKGDTAFVHQHCVDAYGAQHAGGPTKPITTAFSLVGLYLLVERDYTGREIQQAHTTLGDLERDWPQLDPPSAPGDVTVRTVLEAEPGDERDERIERWAESVWEAWEHSHGWVRRVCSESLALD